MKKSVLPAFLVAYFLLLWFFPRNTEGIELSDRAEFINDNNDAAIYPNPVKDFLFIRPGVLNAAWAQGATLHFEIRNILGNSMPVAVEKIEQDRYRIDTADYPAGYYLLMIQCESCEKKGANTRNAFKFLKQ